MNKFLRYTFPVLIFPVLCSGCSEQVSFAEEVMPLLHEKCAGCHEDHGEGLEKSAFSVMNYISVMRGTRFGPVIVAGHSEISTLFQLISHQADPKIQMPPHHEEALPDGRGQALSFTQIALVKDWIDQGAMNN